VDVDVDSRDLAAQQQGSNDLASNLTGMSFFRTATKQEKAKAGKPILKYTPTQQEINMAKVVGFGASKSKKGRKSLWF
jgi:hypothetical protein